MAKANPERVKLTREQVKSLEDRITCKMIIEEDVPLLLGIIRFHNVYGPMCYIDNLDKNLINWIRKKNMSIMTFTITKQKQLIKAQLLGVDGVFMDDPHLN